MGRHTAPGRLVELVDDRTLTDIEERTIPGAAVDPPELWMRSEGRQDVQLAVHFDAHDRTTMSRGAVEALLRDAGFTRIPRR